METQIGFVAAVWTSAYWHTCCSMADVTFRGLSPSTYCMAADGGEQ